MYIKKIKSIEHVGSFYKYNDSALEFSQSNIIYALNGYGKTTLTSIFKSIKDNTIEIITGRKSLNSLESDKQKIIIESEGGQNFIFGNSWKINSSDLSSPNSDILIFDDEFVANNIFAEKFEIDHKKALYRIIFGIDGIRMSQELNEARINKKELERQKNEKASRIKLDIYNLSDYIKIDTDLLLIETIDLELSKIEKQIDSYANQEKIHKRPSLQTITQSSLFDIEKLNILYRSLNNEAHDQAKEKVNQFKSEYFHDQKDAESFLKIGFEQRKDDCPFCHKPLDDEELLNLYRDFFDKSYDELHQEISDISFNFSNWNLSTHLEAIKSILNANIALYEQWKSDNQDISTLLSFALDEQTMIEIKQKIEMLFTTKIKNLNVEIESSLIDAFQALIAAFISTVEQYNDNVLSINHEIDSYKEALKVSNIAEFKNIKLKLLEEKNRLNPIIDELCKEIIELDVAIENAELDINTTQAALNTYSQTIKTEYLDLINDKLINELGIESFKLSMIEEKSGANAKEAYVEVFLELLDQKIPMQSYKDEQASFKNTLSRGDKNSLAFAFFLAFLDKKSAIENTCLIFDDPLSSHDQNRQDSTALVIKKLSSQVKQVIVFTHKLDFVSRLQRKFKGTAEYFELNKSSVGSSIHKVNVDELLKEEFYKILDKLEKYTVHGSAEVSIGNLLNDVRKVFEAVLITKYYTILKDEKFSLTSYSTLDKNFFAKGLLTDPEIQVELIDLTQLSNDGSHGDYSALNEVEMKHIIRRTFSLMQKI